LVILAREYIKKARVAQFLEEMMAPALGQAGEGGEMTNGQGDLGAFGGSVHVHQENKVELGGGWGEGGDGGLGF
jgi:hypothetical protein